MNSVWELHDRMFSEDELKSVVLKAADLNGWERVRKACAFAETCHSGQVRKGLEKIPFINHPLLVAAHAVWLGIADEDILCTCLLHDVCEDCDVPVQELPASDKVRKAVAVLTKERGIDYLEYMHAQAYFSAISRNPLAGVVKILDRCSNISHMASSFSGRRLREYVRETEEFVLPILQLLREQEEYSNAMYLVEYHLRSVLMTYHRMFS